MAEKKESALPWPGLLAVGAAVAGMVFYLAPLDTSRPVEKTGVSMKPDRPQDVDARLWQDPLVAAYAHEAGIRAIDPKTRPLEIAREYYLHSIAILRAGINTARSGHDTLLVLPVIIPGGPYAEYAENRLRMRQAVLEGLATNGFSPQDGEHIGYARIHWSGWRELLDQNGPALNDWEPKAGDDPTLLVPYEWCQPIFGLVGQNRAASSVKKVLVLWLRDQDFQERPLTSLVDLLQVLDISGSTSPVKVIGPSSSTGLRGMVDEALDPKSAGLLNGPPADPSSGSASRGPLAGVTIFSPLATASEAVLLLGAGVDKTSDPQQWGSVKKLLQAKLPDLTFFRTTTTDEDACRTLLAELGRRGVDAGQHAIALISEWDTFYGRALPLTFAQLACQRPLAKLLNDLPENLRSYHYLRGIDGRLPNNTDKEPAKPDGSTSPSTDDKEKTDLPRETTEGVDQADYLRRLATRLQEWNESLLYKKKGGLKAVGVLGSDVYDKLLVLKALRRVLPGVLFFTDNLDARLAHPDEWVWARNLIVASPFGLRLNSFLRLDPQKPPDEQMKIPLQGDILPFRDSYQTAVYTAAIMASNEQAASLLNQSPSPLGQPRLFEIARSGAYELAQGDTDTHPTFDLQPGSETSWWSRTRTLEASAVGVWLLLLLAWVWFVLIGLPHQKSALPATTAPLALEAPDSQQDWVLWLHPVAVLTLGALLAWLWIMLLVRLQPIDGEPFAWFEGISIWPTELIRFLAVIMAVMFFWKTSRALGVNQEQIKEEFQFNPPRPRADRSLHWFSVRGWQDRIRRLTLLYWEVKDPRSGEIDAQALWNEYVWSGVQSRRLWRVIPLVTCYLGAAIFFMAFLGTPYVPYRRTFSLACDHAFLGAAILASTFLTFYVADATILNRRLIQYITAGDTHWPDATYRHIRRNRKLTLKLSAELPRNILLCDYLDIELIAMRTEVVSNLIYYPFVVLFLLIISRINLIANWDWPVSLVFVMLFNGGYAAWSAFRLRNTAEGARKATLQRLSNLLVANTAAGAEGESEASTIKVMISAIQAEDRGAFAAISHHPIFGAILLPSGGLGIWALSQYLPNLF